jgi:iron complex outermembrane receptor protein
MTTRRFLTSALLIGAAAPALQAQDVTPSTGAVQPDEAAHEDEIGEEAEDAIVVTGARTALPGQVIGDIPPEVQLGPADIRSYGVNSIAELLSELSPQTGGGQGRGGAQVVLLNGRRISSVREISNFPTEAIARIDILPEEVALRYGYPAGQKVVNIVLRRRFRALTAELGAGTSTEGGGGRSNAELGLFRLRGDTRLNVNAEYQRGAPIYESDRDIVPLAPRRPFDFAGNVSGIDGLDTEIDPALSALASTPVTIAGVPGATPALADFAGTANLANVSDISRYRTLRPETDNLEINATLARPLSARVSGSLNLGFEASGSQSLNGVPGFSLIVPAGNPFSPFGTNVVLDRYADAFLLRQNVASETFHAGATLQGVAGAWNWSLNGNFDRVQSRTSTVTGVDIAGLQGRLDGDDPAFNPFAPIPAELYGPLAIDRARSISNAGGVELVAYGSPLDLPAGPLSVTAKLGGEVAGFESRTTRGGIDGDASLSREGGSGQVSTDLPITSRRRGFGAAIGDLSANFNASYSRLSDFGGIASWGYGLNWRPVQRLSFLWSMTTEDGAPTMQQLGNPVVRTPGVAVFDYVTGQTVFVTQISGGNPDLESSRRRTLKLGLTATLSQTPQLSLNANYFRIRTTDSISSLPAATAAIQAAFPERFLRDEGGDLGEIDNLPVNFARERREQLRWGLNLSVPLRPSAARLAQMREVAQAARAARQLRTGEADPGQEARVREFGGADIDRGPGGNVGPERDGAGEPRRAGGGQGAREGAEGRGGGFGGGRRGGGFGGGGGRLNFALYHTWTLRSDILIRDGLPLVDLLEGGALGASGGQPRHLIEGQAGYARNGLGARLSVTWRSATQVDGGTTTTPETLYFNDLATVNLRLFADFGQIGTLGRQRWARGLRLSLGVNNLFNARQRVRNDTGATPLSYQPDLLDPLGREVRLVLRKLF